MKPNNLILFLDRKYALCKAFGLFGKENLIYKDEFDHRAYQSSTYVKYYSEEMKADLMFVSMNHIVYDNVPAEEINSYQNKIIMISDTDIYYDKCERFRETYPGCKLVLLWMWGEVFPKKLFDKCKSTKIDLILSASNQSNIHLNDMMSEPYDFSEIGIFDPKLSFKYFYYYIGYYYLTDLMSNMKEKKFDKNQLPIFTYSKATNDSSWRSEILNRLHKKFPNKIFNGSSINDSYDLEFTKYKHFETINDYNYKNYNLVFETIYYQNNSEYFITEKTFKALFFNHPFFLVGPIEMIKELSKHFFLLNSEFKSIDEFIGSNDLESKFEYFVEKSKDNRKKLMEYIHDYSYTEYFKKLLNN
jgi:hypothetical protein